MLEIYFVLGAAYDKNLDIEDPVGSGNINTFSAFEKPRLTGIINKLDYY
jgi:hypothetical protein